MAVLPPDRPRGVATVVPIEVGATSALIALRGDQDLATVPALHDALAATVADGAARVVMLDLRDAESLSCATVDALLSWRQRIEACGGALRVIAPSGAAARVLELTGAAGLLHGPDGGAPSRPA